MLLKFKAKNEQGETVQGTRESADKFTLAREMRSEGLVLISAEDNSVETAKSSWLSNLFKTVSLKEKIMFASNLSSMITAGLALSRALEVLKRQTVNKYFKQIIGDLLSRVEKGESFSQALTAHPEIFPQVFSAMVSAGEESGNLPQSLVIVKEQMSKSYDLQRKVRGAMIYPSVIVCAIIIVAILMMIFMVPTLTATFNDLKVPLPLLTRIVIAISNFMRDHYLIFTSLLALLVISTSSFLRTAKGKRTVDYIILHMPVIAALDREVNSAVVMRTISSLISSGVSMVEAMKITERVLQNSFFKTVVGESAEKIEKGLPLSKVFQEHEFLFPVLVGELTEVGEETGDLASMLLNGAKFYEDEVDQATKNLSTIVEPVLMIIIGVAVGFFVVAMISPMYSLTNAI